MNSTWRGRPFRGHSFPRLGEQQSKARRSSEILPEEQNGVRSDWSGYGRTQSTTCNKNTILCTMTCRLIHSAERFSLESPVRNLFKKTHHTNKPHCRNVEAHRLFAKCNKDNKKKNKHTIRGVWRGQNVNKVTTSSEWRDLWRDLPPRLTTGDENGLKSSTMRFATIRKGSGPFSLRCATERKVVLVPY